MRELKDRIDDLRRTFALLIQEQSRELSDAQQSELTELLLPHQSAPADELIKLLARAPARKILRSVLR